MADSGASGGRRILAAATATTWQRLLLVAIIAVALAAIAIAALLFAEREDTQRAAGATLVDRDVNAAAGAVISFFRPIAGALQTVETWGRDPDIELVDPDSLDRLLVPLLDQHPAVTSLTVVFEEGWFFELDRVDGDWSSRTLESASDIAGGPWHRSIVDSTAGEFVWSDGGISTEEEGEGFTVALRSQLDAARNPGAIYAFTITRESVEQMVTGLPMLQGGELLLLSADGTLLEYAPSGDRLFLSVQGASPLAGPDREGSTAVRALLEWRLKGRSAGPFRFDHAGKHMWAAFVPVEEDRRPALVGIVVPDTSLRAALARTRRPLLPVLVTVASLGFLLVAVLAVSSHRRLRRIARERGYVAASQERLLELLEGGESDTIEFKSTLRWSLHRDKPDKKIEKSAMKTIAAFFNSHGGTLLIGVTDEGECVGIEGDQFPNEDRFLLHFNNLIKEHIGLENLAFLDFELRSVSGHRILVVDCLPTTEPVFLRAGQEEHFYVRVGPGTRDLAPSQVVEYLRTR